jgi:hypothetical protein
MACRSKERGQAAREEIIAESGSRDVSLMIVDLARWLWEYAGNAVAGNAETD